MNLTLCRYGTLSLDKKPDFFIGSVENNPELSETNQNFIEKNTNFNDNLIISNLKI